MGNAASMDEVVIIPMDHGPLLIRGPVVFQDLAGNRLVLDKPQVALCRCGQSRNKPFCDGSHRESFQSAWRAE